MGRRRRFMILYTCLAVLVLAGIVAGYAYRRTRYVLSDNARVAAPLLPVVSPPGGYSMVRRWYARLGETVPRGAVLAALKPVGGGAPTFLRAPAAGTVVWTQGTVGGEYPPGEPLLYLADLQHRYIRAIVTETSASRVRPGEHATVTAPSYPGSSYAGVVSQVQPGTRLALAPASSLPSLGPFSKQTQWVEVRVRLLHPWPSHMFPGMSVAVTIRVPHR